jgi:hypothetical protein
MRGVILFLPMVCLAASSASAQTREPIPPFAADVRGFYAGLGEDPVTADYLAIDAATLPKRGFGGALGLTIYPVRRQGFAIGLGGEGLLAWGRAQPVDAAGTPAGPPVERRLQSLAGQLSFNFGHRDGWSYVSGGLGPLLFETFVGELPPESPKRDTTLNFGGGARWFNTRHFAFCFDLRFYETKPALATATSHGRERKRLLVLSVGASFK